MWSNPKPASSWRLALKSGDEERYAPLYCLFYSESMSFLLEKFAQPMITGYSLSFQ